MWRDGSSAGLKDDDVAPLRHSGGVQCSAGQSGPAAGLTGSRATSPGCLHDIRTLVKAWFGFLYCTVSILMGFFC